MPGGRPASSKCGAKIGKGTCGVAILRGDVSRITYRDEATHYTVAKLEVDMPSGEGTSRAVEVTIVGRFPSLVPGEWLEVEGEWYVHSEFGRQFRVTGFRKAPPVTAKGIERYLASGAAKGIGPKLAQRLVAKFGERTLEVIEKEPHRLLEVEGIGAQKKKAIAKALQEEREAREALVFLQSYGITPGIANKIYRRYGPDTIATVRENPYRLADEIFGIGFKTADAIAQEMGVGPDAPIRAQAALVYLLGQAGAEGHVYLPKERLMAQAEKMGIPNAAAEKALKELAARGALVWEAGEQAGALPGSGGPGASARAQGRELSGQSLGEQRVDGQAPGEGAEPQEREGRVYPAAMHRAEVEAARRFAELCYDARLPLEYGAVEPHEKASEPPGSLAAAAHAPSSPHTTARSPAGTLTAEQREAVRKATEPGPGLLVITGGPGTGKTTTLRAIVAALESQGRAYYLAAPTGRAAKRLQEATGREARTLHRLLEYTGGSDGVPRFQRNERQPLDADVVIVDEASMIDLPLAYYLLRALPQKAKLILVGDADQLPSVGPGNVLRDLLSTPGVPSIRLSQVFRQAETSRIVVNAHRILRGQKPLSGGEGSDFFFLPESDPEKARELIRDLVARRLPNYLSCDPKMGVQALAAVRRGPLGVASLNQILQEALNPPRPGAPEVRVGDETLRPGDRVMQVKNNYDKMVFNGDIGVVTAVDPAERVVEVHYADRDDPEPVVYESADLRQLTLAYCISVHKSQGSEYPAVVMPVTWVMPALMHRNLLYTAITRAKRLVVLVGREDALWAYVRNVKAEARYTRLAERLAALLGSAPDARFLSRADALSDQRWSKPQVRERRMAFD